MATSVEKREPESVAAQPPLLRRRWARCPVDGEDGPQTSLGVPVDALAAEDWQCDNCQFIIRSYQSQTRNR